MQNTDIFGSSTMPSIFSENAIISGDIDYYCLVCDDRLNTEDNVNAHIKKFVHKKKLDQTGLSLEIYENERIRKVNTGYYCEYCNILLTNSLTISFHIKHKNHEYNKSEDIDVTTINKHLKRHENCIIAFDYLLLKEEAWNGLIDNNCVYCNIEFNNKDLHKMETNHILKIIQAQLLIGEKQSVYRKIDNHTFHCVTCNELLPLPIESHFEQDTHDERYIQCRRDKKALHDKMQKTTLMTETPKNRIEYRGKNRIPKQNLLQKQFATQSLTKLQVDVNKFSNTNEKFKDKETDITEVTSEENETDNQSITELDPLEALVKKLNLKDYIYYNEKGNPLCVLCEWNLSDSDESVKAHIQGRHYQEIIKLHNQRIEKDKRGKTNDSDNKETIQSRNDVTETSSKENNSKCEHALKINDCATILTEEDNKISSMVIQSTDKSDILNSVIDLQKHAIIIDFIYEKALCKKCNIFLSFEIEVIRNHIKEHHNTNLKDYSDLNECDKNGADGTKLFMKPVFMLKSENELEMPDMATTDSITETRNLEKVENNNALKFACENNIYYNFSPNQSYCRICRTQIPNGLTSMKEHVRGARHTKNTPETNINTVTSVISQKPYRTKSLEEFIESLGKIENLFQVFMILNKKFCINPRSFNFITTSARRMRCNMCEENFNESDGNYHVSFHIKKLMSTQVIVSEETEFLRILRDGIFHCGFCNLILPRWKDVQNHMKSSTHRNNKMKSDWTLEEFLMQADQAELRDEYLKILMKGFFNNF